MPPLTEKYKPKNFADVKGREIEIERLEAFIKKFPKKKAIILQGPAGSGKTSLAYALASKLDAEILELNASDLRNKEQIANIIGKASQQQSLFAKNKILLVDEVDGITRDDRGGLSELILLIEKTNFPIIITANNIWDRKFSGLRTKAELIQLKELDYKIIFELLGQIAEKENLSVNRNLLKSIAIKSRGDVRAAINDLQTIDKETSQQEIHERDKEADIFNTIKQILQQLPNHEAQRLYDKVNMPLDEIFLWIEENIPLEYKCEELYRAFDCLSLADVFRGRIHRQQHWRFLVYQNFLLSVGVSSAKKQVKIGFKKYRRPGRILKMWILNQKQQHKKSIAEKYAKYCHISIKRAMKDFFILRQLLKSEKIREKLKLNEKEVEFLNQ
jgi:replication factor C large subunit